MENLIKVGIVEDNPYMREGWETFIDLEQDMCVIGSYESFEDAWDSDELKKCDLIIMDIELPGISGIEGVKKIKSHNLKAEMLMATVFDDDENIFNAVKAGAVGYLLKKTSPEDLVKAIRQAMSGGSPMTPNIARKVINTFHIKSLPSEKQLSERELEILRELATGRSYAEIGKKIFLSVDGVRHHIRGIYKKLEVNSRSEAVSKGINRNLIAI
ncbi:MAG TPA: DNA-binding response regulator [Balneola sp.]|jgi:DNA-binding NarL/FixJ family response regulator|nr:DNA-binding response regulator [Bacteroidota bacterium]HCT51423.1 DNA-binding response regulator [Balneola sp.]|tara:strand:+ start:2151 stop:2792 length:642 start_codon:yes stop_codon:yes gene_type:complete